MLQTQEFIVFRFQTCTRCFRYCRHRCRIRKVIHLWNRFHALIRKKTMEIGTAIQTGSNSGNARFTIVRTVLVLGHRFPLDIAATALARNAYAVAPCQLDPIPAVQPKQWLSVRMRTSLKSSRESMSKTVLPPAWMLSTPIAYPSC